MQRGSGRLEPALLNFDLPCRFRKRTARGGAAEDSHEAEIATKISDPSVDRGPTNGASGARVDQPGTNPRAAVIARLSAELSVLVGAGDFEGARHIHEAIARLLS